MIYKIIETFRKNWETSPSVIIWYDDSYYAKAGEDSSLLICYNEFGEEEGFVTVNDDLGEKILSEGEVIYSL